MLLDRAVEEAAGPQQQAETPGCLRGLPERRDEPGHLVGAGNNVAEAQQTEVGIGGLREPVEDERQHLVHQAGGPGEAPRELAQRPPGPVGLREAEGAEASLDGLGGQGAVVAGERLEQRTEVELLVDTPDGDLMPSQLGVEACQRGGGGVVPVAHDPRQRLGILGYRMDLLLVVELQAVLHGPQVGVALGEHGGVPGVDVARGRKLLERGQRRRRAQRRVLAAVHELEDLDGELGVADAAPAPLDLPLGQPLAGQVALGPCLHVADGPQVFGTEGTVPDPPGGSLGEGGAQAGVPGDGPGLEEGLELPGLRPPVPVGLVGR